MRWYSGIPMTSPELEDETIRIIREVEPNWPSTTRRRPGNRCAWHRDNRGVEIRLVEGPGVLLVHVTTISRSNSPPACRVDPDAANRVHRIIVKGIRCLAARVHRRTYVTNQLEVLVDHIVNPHSRQKLICTIQQYGITHRLALRIAVQDVTKVA